MPIRDIDARLRRLSARRDPHGIGDAFVRMHVGASQAATSQWSAKPNPTPAQCRAQNYALGVVEWQGMKIKVENPAYSAREGVDPTGERWRSTMQAHYGYFAGTRGADGDPVDVFVGPFPESRRAWIINQRAAGGRFDEHKVMVAFVDESQAETAYRMSYEPGWDRFDPPIAITFEQLQWWLSYGDQSIPFDIGQVPEPEQQMQNATTYTPPALSRVFWDSAAQPTIGGLANVMYGLRRNDHGEDLLMYPMTMADAREGADILAMDALLIEAGRLQPKMEAMQRVMEAAGGAVKPVSLQISDPLKRFGGVHVAVIFEMSDGQTVTVWFHNPDMTPAKFTPADDLVSWKWQLNKKDVTIVVAPESGRDLNMREVARRIMRLAEKNSAAFQKANAKRAAALQEVADLRAQVEQKTAQLADLHRRIEVAKVEKEWRAKYGDPHPAEGAIRYHNSTDKYTPEIRLGERITDGSNDYVVTRRSGYTLEVDLVGPGGKIVRSGSLSVDPRSPEFRGNLFKGMAAQDPAATVDAAYKFASATPAFKAWVAKSVDKEGYSPFASAKAIDKAAVEAGLRVEWDLPDSAAMDSAAMDRADPIDVNVFQPGDKVVTADGKDFVVLRQDGWQVSLKGKAGAVHANHLKLASGAKPKRVAMDGADVEDDDDWDDEGDDEGPDFDPQAEFDAMPEDEEEEEGDAA